MLAIRISKAQQAKAWRAMIRVAPVRLISKELVYEVYPAHLRLLTEQGIPYEEVNLPPGRQEKRRRATSN